MPGSLTRPVNPQGQTCSLYSTVMELVSSVLYIEGSIIIFHLYVEQLARSD